MTKRTGILVAIYLSALAAQTLAFLLINDFHFAYPLDDTYIHLAISRNFAENGVWGVSQAGFSASSSSPLYDLILSFFYLFLPFKIIIPLLLNIAAGVAFIIIAKRIFEAENVLKRLSLFACVVLIAIVPTIALTITGMEHLFHISCVLLFIYLASKDIEGESGNRVKQIVILCAIAAVSVGFRYESLFVVLVACLLLAVRRRFIPAFFIGLSACLPVVIVGAVNLANGSYFLPNTLMIKGNMPETSIDGILRLSVFWLERTFTFKHLLSCFLLSFASLFLIPKRERCLDNRKFAFFLIVVISFVLHLSFAGVGWFYRYEAYLIAATLFLFFWTLNDRITRDFSIWRFAKKNKIASIVLFIIFVPLILRFGNSVYKSSLAPKNIYEQQVRVGKFLGEYYKGEPVVLNDVGAACYYGEVVPLDLNGLADVEVVRAIRGGYYDGDFLENYIEKKGARIAVTYESVTDFPYPDNWEKVATWRIQNNVICWKSAVHFYAIGESEKEELRENFFGGGG